MKRTLKEIQKDLQDKEKMTDTMLLHIKGGGCEDKRKGRQELEWKKWDDHDDD